MRVSPCVCVPVCVCVCVHDPVCARVPPPYACTGLGVGLEPERVSVTSRACAGLRCRPGGP